jgi:DNA-directed RNA polymerase specialized sigma24 family protein
MDSLKDAAAYCDMSQAAAKSSLFRMRNDLKEYLLLKGFDL